MKKIFIFVVFVSFVWANPFALTQSDKSYIKKQFNKNQIAKRFINLYAFFKRAKSYPIDKKIFRANLYINKIRSKHDETNRWFTPKEFFMYGYGDCEDYAIAKYFVLKQLGINPNKLYLSVVKVKGSKSFHMVLLYFDTHNIPLVLDNLSWKVLPLFKRNDFKFKFAFNDKASYIFDDNKHLIKEPNINRAEVKKFKQLIQNIDVFD